MTDSGTRELFVAPVDPVRLNAVPAHRKYDALLCSVGYETRSSAIARAFVGHVSHIAGIEFHHGHTDVYRRNRQWFDYVGAEVKRWSDEEFEQWVFEWFEGRRKHGCTHVAIDISSMSRPRIAASVRALASSPPDVSMTVDFLYVPSRYQAAPAEIPDATEALEPVIEAFAGEPADPAEPLLLIFGLGYEPERAASAVDELTPDKALPFFPQGTDKRFTRAVGKANRDVLELADIVSKPIVYDVTDPFRAFSELEAVVGGFLRDGRRPLLLPLGPKIFAAVCLLVAVGTTRPVPVWRVSAGAFEQNDCQPSNTLATLRVSTGPLPASDTEQAGS